MARPPKPIDGAVSDVSDVEPHPSGYRVRFRLNGTGTERYRSTKQEAQDLRAELIQKATGTKAGLQVAPTNLPAFRLRAAETAFHLLDAAGLTHPGEMQSANHLIVAVQRFIEDAKNASVAIAVAEAYTLFLQKQQARNLSPKTIKDYKYFLGPFVEQQNGNPLSLVDSATCYKFVYGQPSEIAKFKAHTYLAAFLAFCTGDNNPNIDPNKDQPWLKRSPINFEKPPMPIKGVQSYTLAEVKTILKKAKERRALGYLIFRLFGLARYDETQRFSAAYGTDWTNNQKIDLTLNRIHFPREITKTGEERYVPIHPTFRKWIDYLSAKGQGFEYVRWDDEVSRRAVEKFGEDGAQNLLRHTAITMDIRAHKDPMATAKKAGTSVAVIESSYMNIGIPEVDARGFFELTPRKLGFR